MTTATLLKENIYLGWLTVSEVESIIVMVGYDGTQADLGLEKELRVLHLDLLKTGSELSHWA